MIDLAFDEIEPESHQKVGAPVNKTCKQDKQTNRRRKLSKLNLKHAKYRYMRLISLPPFPNDLRSPSQNKLVITIVIAILATISITSFYLVNYAEIRAEGHYHHDRTSIKKENNTTITFSPIVSAQGKLLHKGNAVQKIGTCIFIVPLAPKHFHLAHDNILPFFVNNPMQLDLLLVFSTYEEKKQFDFGGANSSRISSIVYADYFDVKETVNPASMKKFLAIDYLRKNKRPYEFYIGIDAETLFFKPLDESFLLHLRQKSSILGFSNLQGREDGLINDTREYFKGKIPEADLIRLFDSPRNWNWWSEIPFFRDEDIDEFFDFIGYEVSSKFSSSYRWNLFDHIVYSYWLMARKNFTKVITDAKVPCCGMEGLKDPKEFRKILIQFKPLWVSFALYKNIVANPLDWDLLQYIPMAFHIDRDDDWVNGR